VNEYSGEWKNTINRFRACKECIIQFDIFFAPKIIATSWGNCILKAGQVGVNAIGFKKCLSCSKKDSLQKG
jgi:hypothetical protein